MKNTYAVLMSLMLFVSAYAGEASTYSYFSANRALLELSEERTMRALDIAFLYQNSLSWEVATDLRKTDVEIVPATAKYVKSNIIMLDNTLAIIIVTYMDASYGTDSETGKQAMSKSLISVTYGIHISDIYEKGWTLRSIQVDYQS